MQIAGTLRDTCSATDWESTGGSVALTLTSNDPAGPCPAVSDTIVVTINPVAVANAGPDQTVCASSPVVTLAGSVSGVGRGSCRGGGEGSVGSDEWGKVGVRMRTVDGI